MMKGDQDKMRENESLRSRSERLGGIGTIVCMNRDTGETWTDYDLGKIAQRESEYAEALEDELIGKSLLITGVLYALVKNKIGGYLGIK
jgi:hypothetical protein